MTDKDDTLPPEEPKKYTIVRDDSPPFGGWRVQVPQTGVFFIEGSAMTLRNKVRQHLVANGHEVPPNYREWIEDLICQQGSLDGTICAEIPKEMPEQVKTLTWAIAERFIKTIWGLSKSSNKPKLVPLVEAERRATICAKCPLNVELAIPCKGCRGLIKRAAEVLGGRTTSLDKKLESCAACGCDLKLKVHISNEIIDKAEARKNPDYAPGCWRLEPRNEG